MHFLKFAVSVFFSILFLTFGSPINASVADKAARIDPKCVDWFRILNERDSESDSNVQKLLTKFSEYEILPLGQNSELGLILRKKFSETERPLRTLRLVSSDSDFKFLNRQVWGFDNAKYYFIDVGFKNLEAYSAMINRRVLVHLEIFPDENLKIVYDPLRIFAGELMGSYRWAMHDAVLQRYKAKKKYLTKDDFLILKNVNRYSKNNDVFGLLRYGDTPLPITISKAEVAERLLMTIQVSYYGDRDFFRPRLRHLKEDSNLSADETEDRLPFEYRLPKSIESKEFRSAFYAHFEAKLTCELLRYASFYANLPVEIEDLFVFKAFNSILDQGMRHIVISVDDVSARLFNRRYGFELYRELPIPHEDDDAREYLYYIDTDSPQFFKTYYALKKNAKQVNLLTEVQ